MLDRNRDPRIREMYRRLTYGGHEFLLDSLACRKKDEIRIQNLRTDTVSMPEAVCIALKDLEDFFAHSLGVKFSRQGKTQLAFQIADLSALGRDYTISIGDDGILVSAEGPRGAARALFRLQSIFKLRRAPYIRKGVLDSRNTLNPALAYPAFKKDSTSTLEYPEAYRGNYLLRIARAGYTGFHLNLRVELFYNSSVLPEFNSAGYSKKFEELNQVVQAAARCGLEVFLSLYLEPIDGTHPVFKRLPEIRGSRFVNTDHSYILCSSHPLVHEFYCEQIENLFRGVPGLGGVLLLSGCEGWLHCHTACAVNGDDSCDCPRCAARPPEKSVAEMFNRIAASVKKTAPAARCIIWNYGIFAWTDLCAEKFISFLSKDCEVMANFDTGDDFELEGAHGTRFDYSLSCVGPSAPYSAQSRTAKEHGLKMHAKCESGSPLEYCSIQFLPAMTRWHRKYANLLAGGADGALFNWKFIGYTESLSAELAGLMSNGECDEILRRLAVRDFGKDNASGFLKAWRSFDRAMDFHPFSIGTAGYFKGPFYIGFAQPLFLYPEATDDLPSEFFGNGRKRPLFVTDLRFVQPFGVKACLHALRKLEQHWSDGLIELQKVNMHPEDPYLMRNIADHLALCRAVLCILRTTLNMVDFYRLRESLNQEAFSLEEARETLEAMRETAIRELQNTKDGLEAIRANHSIAFSYGYRYGISETMCLYKIAHTEKLIGRDIPQYYYNLTFSRNRHPQWLHIK